MIEPRWVNRVRSMLDAWIGVIVIPNLGFFFFLSGLGCIAAAVPLIQMGSIENIVNSLIVRNELDYDELFVPLKWIGLFSCALLVGLLIESRAFLTFIGLKIESKIRIHLQARFLQKVITLDLEACEESETHDKIDYIQRFFQGNIGEVLVDMQRICATGVGMFAILCKLSSYDFLLASSLLCAGISVALTRVRLGDYWWRQVFDSTNLLRRVNYIRQLLTHRESATEVRLFGLQDHLQETHSTLAQDRLIEIQRKSWRHLYRQIPLVLLSPTFSGIAIVLIILRTLDGSIEIGSCMAVIYVMLQFESNSETFGRRLDNAWKFLCDIEVVARFISSRVESAKARKTIIARDKAIQLHRVGYKYPGRKEYAVRDINIEIGPREKVAVVGPNGSGKTTLLKLLLGLYSPKEGWIAFDGETYPEERVHWFEDFSTVMQDAVRYSFTVSNNIGFGQIERSSDFNGIRQAACMAGADSFVEALPNGFETRLGKAFDEGTELSVGQWQRISLARSFFRNASTLVLDEPTSGIDPISELELLNKCISLASDRRLIIVSHRLGVTKLVDRVIYMENGRIIGDANHAMLLETCELYSTFFQSQQSLYD